MKIESKQIVYADNNATTRIAPEVFEAMVPYLTEYYGNPSSAYRFGAKMADSIKEARARVADLLGCAPEEILFTSCGTESDNTAVESALKTSGRTHIVTSQVEHSAIMKQAASLERRGHAVTYIPVDSHGLIDPAAVEAAIRPETALVTIMWANNETGVLSPIAEIAEICAKKRVLFHTDAVQVPGKIPIRVHELPIHFLSISAHKFHAPKGVGALYVRKGTRFMGHLIGGGQEKGRRGGTENVASIVGMGRAAELASSHIHEEQTRVRGYRDRFEKTLLQTVPGTHRNGHSEHRLPNTSNLCFEGLEAESLLHELDKHGICCSAGSACTTGSLEPSHVLKAMGVPNERAYGTLRFSFGRYNTDAEVDRLLREIPEIITKLRSVSPAASIS